MKSDDEYVPKSARIKLEMAVEKGTKEGKAFQSLTEKHSIIIAECQLKIKFLIIEAGDINLVKKRSLPSYPSWNRSTTFQKNF